MEGNPFAAFSAGSVDPLGGEIKVWLHLLGTTPATTEYANPAAWFSCATNKVQDLSRLAIIYNNLLLLFPSEAVVERVFKTAKTFDSAHRSFTPQHLAQHVFTKVNHNI